MKYTSSRSSVVAIASSAILALTTSVSAQQSPYIHYEFNNPDTTTTATNSGTATGLDGQILDSTGTAAALQNVVGVSGQAGDYAFNNSASTMAGAGGTVLGADVRTAISNEFGTTNMGSLTMSMWYYATDVPISSNTRLAAVTGTAHALEFWNYGGSPDGRLSVSRGGTNATNTRPPSADSTYASTGQWVFAALTFDFSTTAANNVNFYKGTLADSVSLVYSGTDNGAGSWNAARDLRVGNYISSLTSAFEGYIDDFRFYVSDDNSAILSSGDLENIRSSAIPEPGHFGVIAAGLALAFVLGRRVRRS
jgi:hypothetical protein